MQIVVAAHDVLTCATCGYDLRETPADGVCPECATPVAESKRLAALPRIASWQDADRVWGRQVLTGLLLLTATTIFYCIWTLDDVRLGVMSSPWLDRAVWHFNPTLLAGIGSLLLFARERYEIKRPWMRLRPWLATIVFAAVVAHLCVRAGLYGNSLMVINSRLFGPPPGDEIAVGYELARYSRLYDRASWYTARVVPLANVLVVLALVDIVRHFHRRILTVVVITLGVVIVAEEFFLSLVHFGVIAWNSLPMWIAAPSPNDAGPPIRLSLLGCGFSPMYVDTGEDGLIWWGELLKAVLFVAMTAVVLTATAGGWLRQREERDG